MTINCPACEGQIEVGDEMLGEGLACPHCEQVFLLTEDGEVTEYEAEETPAGGANRKLIIGVAAAVAVLAIGGWAMMGSGGGSAPAPTQVVKAPTKPASSPEPMDVDAGAPPPAVIPKALTGSASGDSEVLPPVAIPDSPDGAIVAVSRALAEGNPRGLWDALPASYQADVTSLIHDYAQTTDPVMWDRGFGIAGRIAGVLREKKPSFSTRP